MLDLLDLAWLNVDRVELIAYCAPRVLLDRLSDPLSILHLLHLVADADDVGARRRRDGALTAASRRYLLNLVDARVALRVGGATRAHLVEVYRVRSHQVHLVFTRLAEAVGVYVGELQWLGHSDLAALT